MTNPENTGCFGPVYWSSLAPSEKQRRVSTAWTNEIEPPWRHGRGLAVRAGTRLWTVGIWRRGSAPSSLSQEEEFGIEADNYKEVEVIRSW